MTSPSSDRQNIPPQLEGEPDRAYEYLLIHVLSGQSRSLPQTAAICGKSASQLEKLSSRWDWQERLKSYDDQFLQDVATKTREKNLSRFQNSFEQNIILNERIMTVSGTVLEALETSIKAMDDPSFDGRIKKILSAAKAVELLSKTVANNLTLHANLTGLELVAKQLLDKEQKNPKQPSDRYTIPKDKIKEDREYLKTLDKFV